MKTLAVDARWLSTGIGRYTLNALATIRERRTQIRVEAITSSRHASQIAPLCDEVRIVNAPIYSVREQLVLPFAVQGADLLHIPHYNAPLFYPHKLLVSILDLTHIIDETYRRTWASRVYARPMLNLVARKAVRIVTLSEYSKWQIVKYLRVPETKISVIYCGVNPIFAPQDRRAALSEIQQKFGLDGPYLLYVGNLKPHKNVMTLLRAFAYLRSRQGWQHQLLIVGDDTEGREVLLKYCDDKQLSSWVHIESHVREELLPKVYAGADLLVLPSFEEGFGLPIIEAMACGTPVVCSRAASLPEVAADAAVLFDPHNYQELADHIHTVLGSFQVRTQLRERGFERAKYFSWRKCGEGHADLYSQLMSNSN